MNIYLISQEINNDYDTYDSAVVTAKTAAKAKQIHPGGKREINEWDRYGSWAYEPAQVKAKLIGVSKQTKEGIILASFNAG